MSEGAKKITKSEEQMMEIFWNSEEPLTSVDIVNMKVKDTWGNGLVHNIIRSLLEKGMLQACGLERCKTQYARTLCPTLTNEEYIAKLMMEKAGGKEARCKVMLAFAKEEENKEETIAELEGIVEELREIVRKEKGDLSN